MTKRKTAGALALKAASDPARYDSLEVGHALCQDVLEQLQICIEKHRNIIDEPEFCVVMVLADDPLIKGVLRRKFYAWPYLPKPRPRQSCFLYRKSSDTIIRLWVLPDAFTMAVASEMVNVAPQWQTMKGWSDAFFDGKFFEHIRHQHGIPLLSEAEYLNANREKLVKAGCNDVDAPTTESFDFSKIAIQHIVDTKTARDD
jgi:hypothetical protein